MMSSDTGFEVAEAVGSAFMDFQSQPTQPPVVDSELLTEVDKHVASINATSQKLSISVIPESELRQDYESILAAANLPMDDVESDHLSCPAPDLLQFPEPPISLPNYSSSGNAVLLDGSHSTSASSWDNSNVVWNQGIDLTTRNLIELEVHNVDRLGSPMVTTTSQMISTNTDNYCAGDAADTQSYFKLADIDAIMSQQNDSRANAESNGGDAEDDSQNDSSKGIGNGATFPCTMCSTSFTKKMLLNNHLKNQHGINYVFTEKGRKVKLVRIMEGCEEAPESPSQSTEICPDPDSTSAPNLDEIEHDNNSQPDSISDGEDEGLGCGLLLKVDTLAYHKALERNLKPFVGFCPLNSSTVYLLTVRNYKDSQLIEPASKSDVIAALQQISKDVSIKELYGIPEQSLPVVAFVRQRCNKETKQVEFCIEPPRPGVADEVHVFKRDQFTEFAFTIEDPSFNEEMENEFNEDRKDDIDLNFSIDSDYNPEIRRRRKKDKRTTKNKQVNFNFEPQINQIGSLDATEDSSAAKSAEVTGEHPEESTSALPASTDPASLSTPTSTAPVEEVQVKEEVQEAEAEMEAVSSQNNPANNHNNYEPPENSIFETPKRPAEAVAESVHKRKLRRKSKSGNSASSSTVDLDGGSDSEFVPDATCAPARESPKKARRRGRPRKLKFEDCESPSKKSTNEQ